MLTPEPIADAHSDVTLATGAIDEDSRIARDFGDRVFNRAVEIARAAGSRSRDKVLVTREHMIQAEGEMLNAADQAQECERLQSQLTESAATFLDDLAKANADKDAEIERLRGLVRELRERAWCQAMLRDYSRADYDAATEAMIEPM